MDLLTGRVAVCRYLAATDGGQVLNPRTFAQQVQGAIAQGIGEVGINGHLPAIAGAIEQALGVRMHQAPLTPPRVLAALQAGTGDVSRAGGDAA